MFFPNRFDKLDIEMVKGKLEAELEKDKPKQPKLQTRQDIMKAIATLEQTRATLEHEYRMALLKTGKVKGRGRC
jgi:hypothetical protein